MATCTWTVTLKFLVITVLVRLQAVAQLISKDIEMKKIIKLNLLTLCILCRESIIRITSNE